VTINDQFVKELTNDQKKEWDDFHDSCPHTHPFQTLGLNEIKKNILHHSTYFFEGRQDDGHVVLTAQINVFHQPKLAFHQAIIPRGPVCSEPSYLIHAFPFLFEKLKEEKVTLLSLSPHFETPLAEPAEKILIDEGFEPAPENSGYVHTSIVNLKPDEEKIFNSFHKKMRWGIRRAMKEEAEIKHLSSIDDLEQAAKLSKSLGEKKQFPSISFDYLKAVNHEICKKPQRGFLLGLWQGKKLLSFAEFIGCGKEIWYFHGASDLEEASKGRSHLLLWSCMQEAKKRGFEKFNLGGIFKYSQTKNEKSGVSNFKLRFSGDMIQTPRDFVKVFKPLSYFKYRTAKKIHTFIHSFR